MNDDIKEILAYFEEYVKITDMHDSEPMLNWKDLKIVLDYITNLQQKYDKVLEDSVKESHKRMELENTLHKIMVSDGEKTTPVLDLMKENERLKEQNNDLRKIYRNTYNKLFENGNDELARYFQAQIDDCPTFYVEPKTQIFIDTQDMEERYGEELYEEYLEKQVKDYKSRIEKAVEYLKSKEDSLFMPFSDDFLDHDELIDKKIGTTLLNILNGEK